MPVRCASVKRPAVIVMLVAAIVLAACGGSGNAKTVPTTVPDRASTTTTSLAANAIFPVHRITLTFVDQSRKTVDQVGTRSAPSRTLPTDVYVPTGAGPFPLIVHAHGSG